VGHLALARTHIERGRHAAADHAGLDAHPLSHCSAMPSCDEYSPTAALQRSRSAGNGAMLETKGFDSQDGIALQWLNWVGIQTGVISGRVSPALDVRARQCKMAHVYQGHIEKIPILGRDPGQIRIHGRSGGLHRRRPHRYRHHEPRRSGIATANARPERERAALHVLNASGDRARSAKCASCCCRRKATGGPDAQVRGFGVSEKIGLLLRQLRGQASCMN